MVNFPPGAGGAERITDHLDRRRVKGSEKWGRGGKRILVGAEPILAGVSVIGANKAVSPGQGDDKRTDRHRCARKGYRIKAVETKHQ